MAEKSTLFTGSGSVMPDIISLQTAHPDVPIWKRARASLWRARWPLVALVILLSVTFLAVLGPQIAPKDPNRITLSARLNANAVFPSACGLPHIPSTIMSLSSVPATPGERLARPGRGDRGRSVHRPTTAAVPPMGLPHSTREPSHRQAGTAPACVSAKEQVPSPACGRGPGWGHHRLGILSWRLGENVVR